MMRVLITWNLIITIALAAMLLSISSAHKAVKVAELTPIIRTGRLEITDRSGKTKAILEADESNSSNPKLTLYDNEGREAAFLIVNSRGYGTLYFQSKQTEGKVSVGYLWGSDSLSSSEQEDPLSSWGIRVLGRNGAQTSFGLFNSDQPIPQTKTTSGARK